MLGKKNEEVFNTSGNLNTIIGKGSSFDGNLKVQSTLRVDGKVKGNITTSESLIVGKEGNIDGEISVRNAIIGGKLKGKLNATGKVVLEANSMFRGELKTSKLVIDEGAVFEGNCSMDGGAEGKGEYGKSVSAILEQKAESKDKEMKVAK
ncbi:polymer-forming cytoskeletal protein [candidate division KSB1 bacterium]|nr:polymer-forming cytoskeletal protein [candidate division KSB1 bacterium]NIR72745.1 polymer-forming cytoskeletal protein [candidate division KSB1 bacterium]NIS26833.1 polymer-forming cytoskeletal protein [candidate division KSB1 bacterium]NIT73627.1 polymer-forming cytoskeletal protein [candidate division KSB1 bacterium]NIU27500.1 polymer-forming cytoskeletal protein [candidate division KSB1 bacterium]